MESTLIAPSPLGSWGFFLQYPTILVGLNEQLNDDLRALLVAQGCRVVVFEKVGQKSEAPSNI